jgi:hypothetical protein
MEIQKTEIDGKLRTVGTIKVDFDEKEEVVELIKLTFGEDLKIRNQCTSVKMIGSQPDIKIDQEKMTLLNLSKSIIKAPFDITMESISDLDKDVATEILSAFNELNTPSEKKKSN